jgi:formylglycine-generating enzyme required for sulfatase activity
MTAKGNTITGLDECLRASAHFQLSTFNFQLIKCFALLCLLLVIGIIPLSAQRVSNVQSSFDKERLEITVSCSLESTAPKDLVLSYSIDNGRTWKRCINVSGDIKKQTTGTKKLIWQPVLDGIVIGEFLFKVTINIENVIEMVFIAGGIFTMGCTEEQGGDCDGDEKPVHQVTLSDFYIGKYEVTQVLWKEVMENNPSYFSGCDNCPVEQVSWNDVQEFIRKLNAMTGENYRLPTEAEWEYAVRDGNQSRGYKYSGSNSASEVAWYTYNSGSKTHPVGEKKGNELGLYDMSGNVGEWCQDWWGNYSSSSQTNPVGASSGYSRVYRGGSWYSNTLNVRASYRNNGTPDTRNRFLGFRLACSSKLK